MTTATTAQITYITDLRAKALPVFDEDADTREMNIRSLANNLINHIDGPIRTAYRATRSIEDREDRRAARREIDAQALTAAAEQHDAQRATRIERHDWAMTADLATITADEASTIISILK